MNYTLHLTQKCNLNCKYCYEKRGEKELSFENIKFLINGEIEKKSKDCIITFYGGEPLLKEDMIYKVVDYIKTIKCKTKFYFGITTNGTLIDDDLIDYMLSNNFLTIAYSFDGIQETQNLNRIFANGESTYKIVEENAKRLLKKYKKAIAMMVVTKNNYINLANNIEHLWNIGFRRLNPLFNYLDEWQDEDLPLLKAQYEKVANFYYDRIMEEEDINVTVFEEKIKTHINEEYNCNEDCQMGVRNINVDADGNFYPCVQFVGNEDYIIGNCLDGVDFNARKRLVENSGIESEACKTCALKTRCKHTCACKNFLTTNEMNGLSPLTCEIERMMIEISDELASKLYNKHSKLFLQKYYNKNYNLIKEIIEN